MKMVYQASWKESAGKQLMDLKYDDKMYNRNP